MNNKETERRKQLFEEHRASEEYQTTLLQRLQINDACLNSSKKREAREYAWNLCAREDNPAEGCIFFIENFGFTFDPRPQAFPHHLPFILFEFQKEYIRWLVSHILEGKDAFVEKSRGMGMTWLTVWVFLWFWLFKDGVNLLVGSYKEALVDNRTDDSMFGKLDYSIDSLPTWILPRHFNKKKHRTKLRLINPVNNNLIAGDTMNPDFGRGSRKTAIFFDELGFWDYAKEAWEGCADTVACRIANSTPNGQNYYASLRKSGIDIMTLHWKQHPLLDEVWYEYEKSRRTEESVAQELDISYDKSQEGRVYPEWNENNIFKGEYEYDPSLPLYVGWDFGREDDTAIIWCQPHERGIKIVDTYARGKGKLIDFFIPFVTGMLPSDYHSYTPKELEIIERHKNWNRGTHFGDPAGRFHNQVTNDTVLSVLKDHGIHVNFQDNWKEFTKRKTAAKLLIRDGIYINNTPETDYFDRCIQQAAYPKVRRQGVEEVQSDKMPLHNWTSHYRSAFEYLALGLSEFRSVRKKPYDKFPKKQNLGMFGAKQRVVGY